MLDFTSSLYLGFRHASHALRPWAQLTTGAPAALVEPAGAAHVAQRLAALQGCQRATLATSSLHLFWDVFDRLARCNVAIILEASSYPIARWGAACAAAHGTPVHHFAHRDLAGLRRALVQMSRQGRRPVVVTDGICTCCGCAAPLRAYAAALRPYGGLLIVDDTQALGLLGPGGGGSVRQHGLRDENVVLVSSLAKAFGVPLAAMSGSTNVIGWFEARSQTRVHCSPPSAAALHAAEHALDLNEAHGDEARRRLVQRVRAFRRQLSQLGLETVERSFPVQTLKPIPGIQARDLYQHLQARGIQAVLGDTNSNGIRQLQDDTHVSFILTARHRPSALAHVGRALSQVLMRHTATQTRVVTHG